MYLNPPFIMMFLFLILAFGSNELTHAVPEIQFMSTSFEKGATIPTKYTCQGAEISPPLSWSKGPDSTKSFAIIVTDPDVPIPFVTFTHWIIYNIPSDQFSLAEDIPASPNLENGIKQGQRTFGQNNYMGPCPPFGKHRYFFRIYALDKMLKIKPERVNRKKILNLMQDHVVAKGEFYGLYSNL